MVKEGDKVKWIDGAGFERHGVVALDAVLHDFRIPVEQRDGTIIRISYKDLNLCEEGK